jgi:RNA polymerase sigma factor (sigma-70 family)
MTENTDDDAAVIAASAGNGERFAVIFDRHGRYLHRYLARRLGPDVADDLVADVFLAAFRRRDRYDTSRPDARPWLYGIAAHAVAQHRREEAHRWRLLAALPPAEHQPGPADEADDRVSAHAARSRLAVALASLNRTEREVLLLIAWEQLSYEQVAQALDVPLGTVRSRLHRARTKLRARLPEFNTQILPIDVKELLTNE